MASAGSKNWLKERAAISAAHRRQKTDPAASRLIIQKTDQLPKERINKHLQDAEEDGEDIDAIVNEPPPEEVVVKVTPKPSATDPESEPTHGKETTEEVYRSFAETVLEQTLTTDASLELSFDLKPEDIVKEEEVEEEEDEEDEEEEGEEGEEEEGDEGDEEGKDADKENEEEGNEEGKELDEGSEEKKDEEEEDNDEDRKEIELNNGEINEIGLNNSETKEEKDREIDGNVEEEDTNMNHESALTDEVDGNI